MSTLEQFQLQIIEAAQERDKLLADIRAIEVQIMISIDSIGAMHAKIDDKCSRLISLASFVTVSDEPSKQILKGVRSRLKSKYEAARSADHQLNLFLLKAVHKAFKRPAGEIVRMGKN